MGGGIDPKQSHREGENKYLEKVLRGCFQWVVRTVSALWSLVMSTEALDAFLVP